MIRLGGSEERENTHSSKAAYCKIVALYGHFQCLNIFSKGELPDVVNASGLAKVSPVNRGNGPWQISLNEGTQFGFDGLNSCTRKENNGRSKDSQLMYCFYIGLIVNNLTKNCFSS